MNDAILNNLIIEIEKLLLAIKKKNIPDVTELLKI